MSVAQSYPGLAWCCYTVQASPWFRVCTGRTDCSLHQHQQLKVATQHPPPHNQFYSASNNCSQSESVSGAGAGAESSGDCPAVPPWSIGYIFIVVNSKDFLVSEYFTENTVSIMTLGLTIFEANVLFIKEWFLMIVKNKIDETKCCKFCQIIATWRRVCLN